MDLGAVMELSSKQISDWQKAQRKKQIHTYEPVSIKSQRYVQWKFPEKGWHKLNVDASIYEGQPSFMIRMVLINEKESSLLV